MSSLYMKVIDAAVVLNSDARVQRLCPGVVNDFYRSKTYRVNKAMCGYYLNYTLGSG
jgi:hypothetical protein